MNTMTTTAIAEPVYKVRDIAVHLGCDEDAVYRLLHEGKMRAIRVGRLWRIPESALADFLAGR